MSILRLSTAFGRLSTIRHLHRCQRAFYSTELPNVAIFKALTSHDPNSPAITHALSKQTFTYGQLLDDVVTFKETLEARIARDRLQNKPVAMLLDNGYPYVVTLLALWMTNAMAVPIFTGTTKRDMQHVLSTAEPNVMISSPRYRNFINSILEDTARTPPLGNWIEFERNKQEGPREEKNARDLPMEFYAKDEQEALMIFTSGSTGFPKGVVSTHGNITAQASALVEAWKMSPSDHLLHVLPLHHMHGIMNATIAPLIAGSHITYLYPADAKSIWEQLSAALKPGSQATEQDKFTLFMAVPTIYNRLVAEFQKLSPEDQDAASEAARNLRIAISGSAALPSPLKQRWKDLSKGGVLLERFGMSEIGMALSCGLPEEERIDNSVGKPLPGYSVRLGDLEDPSVPVVEVGVQGEVQVKGPGVFKRYYKRKKNPNDFTSDGYFRTGDVAVVDKDGNYFIQGRLSMDIIKSGGEKVSALEIEREALAFPEIKEICVLGVPSEEWGEEVSAVVVLNDGVDANSFDLREKLKSAGLMPWKIPKRVLVIDHALERNAMGKINKHQIRSIYFGQNRK